MDTIAFVKQFPTRQFRKGESILSEGEDTSTLLAVQTGFVKVSSLSDNGTHRLLWIAGRYDLVPTEGLFSAHGKAAFFYTALSDGQAYVINKKAFIEQAKQNADFMFEVANSMSMHYDDLMRRLDSVEQNSIQDKLIYTLRYLAERFSADTMVDLFKLGLQLTHQDIADMIGATRETTSIELQKLKKRGLIQYDRNSLVIYVDKLDVS